MQYEDRQTALGSRPVEMILALPPARGISFQLVRTTTIGQYQDRQTALGSWYGPEEIILSLPPAQAISFPLVHTTTLGQSVYFDIALHTSNVDYYINVVHCIVVR